ncbi:MAG: HypC/HybG/HupF family hydrogenase formation chaperone [Actinomycetes bacterium]
MCLGRVGQICDVLADGRAVVRSPGRELVVSLMTIDEHPTVGDWVLVHAGFALAVLTEQQALDALTVRDP